MNEKLINFGDVEEDILHYEVSDHALEAAAGLLEGEAKCQTVSFCTGLESCPS
jgi:hypothetical protein